MKTSAFQQAIHHAYAQTDGTYVWPNSREGDMLKQAKREIDAMLAQIDRLMQRQMAMSNTEFISVEVALPEEIITDGSVNCVLAVWKKDRLDDAIPNPNVCNVTYFNLHVDEFTHWMYLPVIQQ